jgi:hypothetical protein
VIRNVLGFLWSIRRASRAWLSTCNFWPICRPEYLGEVPELL